MEGGVRIHIQNWSKNVFQFIDSDMTLPKDATLQTLKWMPGDSVSNDYRVVKRTASRLVGIIDVLNRTRFGTTARGVPLYIAYPIDKAYPPFLVALKTKPETNVLAIAKYEHWDGVWMRAGLEKIIGAVGDLKYELGAMLQTLPPAAAGVVADGENSPDLSKHMTMDWDVVLHIDPPGCKDVDDVLCWKRRDSNTIIVSIGIADVAAWIPEGSAIDRVAYERGATLYRDGIAIEPMLPAHISESLASLRSDGVLRPAVCLTFDLVRGADGRWRCGGGEGGCGRWELHMLRVTESYTYDSIYEHAERAEEVRTYLAAVCGVAELGADSHEWIERAMILYNRCAGETLRSGGVGLLRAHEGISNETYTALAERTGCRDIGWLGSSAGKYVDAHNTIGHCGLGLTCYTHASSPLRRYVDLLNQRWIRALKFGFPGLVSTGASAAFDCNTRSKRIRRLERDMYFLTRVLGGGSPAAEGFLIEPKASDGGVERWRIYVPEWKRIVGCVMYGGDAWKPGDRATVRMYLDIRQADWNRRFIYQARAAESK